MSDFEHGNKMMIFVTFENSQIACRKKSGHIPVVFKQKMNDVIKYNMRFFKNVKKALVLKGSFSEAKINVRESTAHEAFAERHKIKKSTSEFRCQKFKYFLDF